METFFVFIVPDPIFAAVMKEQILKSATERFLNLGVKSVTMDDIASEMGISKKTLYQYFANKQELITETVMFVFNNIRSGIEQIWQEQHNPMEELYLIKALLMRHLKDEKSSPVYQLQKYYPEIFVELKAKQLCIMDECVTRNLARGIEEGLYRSDLNVTFISKIYFSCMMTLKDQDLFSPRDFSATELMNLFVEYHLRGICSKDGIDLLEKYKREYNES